MTGWMLTEQADLFGMGMDALTPEQAARVLEEADREAPSADGELAVDYDRDAEAALGLQDPSHAAQPLDLDDDLGVLFEGAVGRAAEWVGDEQGEREPGSVPTARHYEFVCAGCFLIWHRQLLGDPLRRLCRDCAEDLALIRRRAAEGPCRPGPTDDVQPWSSFQTSPAT